MKLDFRLVLLIYPIASLVGDNLLTSSMPADAFHDDQAGDHDDFDDEDEDFFPRNNLLTSVDALTPSSSTEPEGDAYGDLGTQSWGQSLIESRGMMGKGKGKGGGGGGGGIDMSTMMINLTNDGHYYDKYDDDDDHDFEVKAEPEPERIPNCKFQLPDKVIGMQKYVYIPRITVFDTDSYSDVMSVKGESYDAEIEQCPGCKKKKKKKGKKKKKSKGKKKKKKKGRR